MKETCSEVVLLSWWFDGMVSHAVGSEEWSLQGG